MDGERYDAESFCIEENEAFRWFQGYQDVTPVFCIAALERMADEAPASVRAKINKSPLGERLLSRLYFSGFPDVVMDELFPKITPEPEVVEPVELPVARHITILPPVTPVERPSQRMKADVQCAPIHTRTILSALQPLSSDRSDALDQDDGWEKYALCAETDPEAFFPEKGGSTREAKKVCAECDVRAQCLDRALANDERFGIWGGLSERERRKLKRRVV